MNEDATKTRIMEGAKKLFQLYGFTRITIDEVAVNLKISKKTIYKHFKSKDDLIISVAGTIMAQARGQIRNLLARELSFPETMMELLKTMQGVMMQITPPMIQDMRSMPHIWEEIDARRKLMIREHFSTLIERGQKSGEIRKDVDPKFLEILWLQVVTSVATPQFFMEYDTSPFEFIKTLISVLTTGILTEKGKKKLGGVK
ncbi:MAG: TetR/AcrR family transcriptional regulator [Pseudomonadota bacterium]